MVRISYLALILVRLGATGMAEPVFDCPEIPEGFPDVFIADDEDCTAYYRCARGKELVRLRCPDDRAFNPVLQICDFVANVVCDLTGGQPGAAGPAALG